MGQEQTAHSDFIDEINRSFESGYAGALLIALIIGVGGVVVIGTQIHPPFVIMAIAACTWCLFSLAVVRSTWIAWHRRRLGGRVEAYATTHDTTAADLARKTTADKHPFFIELAKQRKWLPAEANPTPGQ